MSKLPNRQLGFSGLTENFLRVPSGGLAKKSPTLGLDLSWGVGGWSSQFFVKHFNFEGSYFEMGWTRNKSVGKVLWVIKKAPKLMLRIFKAQSWTFEMKAQPFIRSTEVKIYHAKIRKSYHKWTFLCLFQSINFQNEISTLRGGRGV